MKTTTYELKLFLRFLYAVLQNNENQSLMTLSDKR